MNYTITTTSDQEALLSWITATYNREHDTSLSTAEYVTLRLPELLQPFSALYQDYLLKQVQAKFLVASPDVRQQIIVLLGGLG